MRSERRSGVEQDNQTLVGGLRAVELYFRVIREISSGNAAFLQSQTRLNTPGLGVMLPENFRDVSEITNQCISLFELELVQALEWCSKFIEREIIFDWLSVYMPADYLKNPRAEYNILGFCDRFKVNTNKMCFALSAKLLEQTDGKAALTLRNLRNKGFHFMLTGFGSDSCPMMKLSEYDVDYVMLSPEVTHFLGKNERSDGAVKSIIDFISELDAIPVADGVQNSRQAEKLYEYGCGYCAGSLVGKYTSERYIRRKNDDGEAE